MLKLSFVGLNQIEGLYEDKNLEKVFVEAIEAARGIRINENEFWVEEESLPRLAIELQGCGSVVIDPCQEGFCQSFLNDWL